MEDETKPIDPVKTGVKICALGILTVCLVGGIIMNALLIKRNKGFPKEKEKLSDIKFFFSLLAVFNILYLIDVIPFSYYLINYDVSEGQRFFCRLYNYYSQITMFGIFYCIVSFSKDSFILSQNNPKFKFSNRFQMIAEAVTVWLIFLISFLILEWNLSFDRLCFKQYFAVIFEFISGILSLISLIFAAITYCKARKLNLQDSLTMHFIVQARIFCFLYFILWIPSIILTFIAGHLVHYGSDDDVNRTGYFFRVFSYVLQYVACAIFPLLCKGRKNVIVEHELI